MGLLPDPSAISTSTITWLTILLDASFKGTVVLAVAGLLCLLLRRASAASRHLIWCVGVGSVVALPFLPGALPAWRLPVLPLWSGRASRGTATFTLTGLGNDGTPQGLIPLGG